jgi:hypothetical protein
MEAETENGRLIITLPLQEPTPSKSGQVLLVASSRGVWKSPLKVEGKVVHINVNAFVYPEDLGIGQKLKRPVSYRLRGRASRLPKIRSNEPPVEWERMTLESPIEREKQEQTTPKAKPKKKGGT